MFDFEATLWLHEGQAAWYFLTLPFDVTDEIDAISTQATRGFGSVRVSVTIGRTTWATSVFPDSKRGAFVLPVKAAVRKAEGIAAGDTCRVQMRLIDVDA